MMSVTLRLIRPAGAPSVLGRACTSDSPQSPCTKPVIHVV